MNKTELLELVRAGYTKEEIEALDLKPQEEEEPARTEEETEEPEEKKAAEATGLSR